MSIGGFTSPNDKDPCSTVELFHTGDAAWTSLTSLPTPALYPSATLIGELIYVMADEEHGYICQLTDLLANKKPLPPLAWKSLPPLPRTMSIPSSCILGGQLVVVGRDRTIWQLIDSSWSACGTLSGSYREFCLLTSPTPHTMVAVGAYVGPGNDVIVDVCIVV